MDLIPPGKRLIGDRGYNGEPEKISTPNDHDAPLTSIYKSRVRSRHETFNGRLKDFKILDDTFRHTNKRENEENFDDHERVFQSICVLIQYDMKYKPLFEI
jgi:hypothetical protein